MSDQCIGEIRIFAGQKLPAGWAWCDGSLLQITNNEALYSLLGKAWGGDGITTFGLPDLRSRLPIGQGTGTGLTPRTLGQTGGNETVTLAEAQMPSHTHALMSNSTSATCISPAGTVMAQATETGTLEDVRYLPTGLTPEPTHQKLNPNSVSFEGSGQAHSNVMPSFGINFIIALEGVYPQSA
jgi:microcystin-dependent protein